MNSSTSPLAGRPLRNFATISQTLGALLLVTLAGQVVDKTTGQPLTGVDVSVRGPAKANPARTNDGGRYVLRGLAPGRYTVTLSSDDVPPQTFEVNVRAAKSQAFDMTACSTTLDYSCASALP